jgi:Trypsin-like serine proteases, typically periplasmic, contain C-terminal PDZ domain
MNRILGLVALFSFFVLTPLYASDWVTASEHVEPSMVRITFPCMVEEGGTHTCAGFVIGDRFVLTAYHCVLEPIGDERVAPPAIFLDGVKASILQAWPEEDLVVLAYEGSKPPLDYRRKGIRKGLPVAALGFAYGLPTSTLLTGMIASPAADWGQGGTWLTIDRPLVKGMSGGPIFDEDGRVMGISQQTDPLTGFSRELSTILKRTKKYWNRFANPAATERQPVGMPSLLLQAPTE